MPSIDACGDPLERWKETFWVRWRTSGHNNIGELRIVILALRHASCSSKAWGSRLLLITRAVGTSVSALVRKGATLPDSKIRSSVD